MPCGQDQRVQRRQRVLEDHADPLATNATHAIGRQIVDAFSDYQRRIDQVDVMSLVGLPDWLPRWRSPAERARPRSPVLVL